MAPWTPFIRRREPLYDVGSPPVSRESGAEPRTEIVGIPEPVRDSDFDGIGHRVSQLFTTFDPWQGFGTSMGMESFGGKIFQPDPNAATPYGELGVDTPRRVVVRPPSRATG